MKIRSHQEYTVSEVTTVDKYIMVEDDVAVYIVPEECLRDLDDWGWRYLSVLTVNKNDKTVTKSRFF
jgi:hypothetical protein